MSYRVSTSDDGETLTIFEHADGAIVQMAAVPTEDAMCGSEYRAMAGRLQLERDALVRTVEALREALRELTSDPEDGLSFDYVVRRWECIYCDGHQVQERPGAPFLHDDDCPVAVARALLD